MAEEGDCGSVGRKEEDDSVCGGVQEPSEVSSESEEAGESGLGERIAI